MDFYLKESNSDTALIMMRHYDRQFSDGRFVYSTKERIEPWNWIQPTKGSGKPKRGHEALQTRLFEIARQANEFITLNRSSLSKEGLRNFLDGLRPKEKPTQTLSAPETIIALWDQFLKSLKGTVQPQSYQNYRNSFETVEKKKKKKKKKTTCTNFTEFLSEKKWLNITPDKFTSVHYMAYVAYLRASVKPNTVAKRLKHFKAAMKHIQDDLKIQLGFDLNKIKYKEKAGLKISLSEAQLEAYIAATSLPENLVKVRDLCVVQCSTGLRISDRGRIDKNISGSKIKIETKKTGTFVEILISPQVREILEKYNYALPQISEQDYREGIKAIHKLLYPNQVIQLREKNGFRTVHVWEEISSHDMVRTFITLSIERGMNVGSVATITGKTIATILKSYHVESQEVADKEMEKAWCQKKAA